MVQLTFLKLLSAMGKQTFTYTCQNSAGWYDSATRSHQYALRLRGSNDEELSQAKTPFLQALYDGCQVGPLHKQNTATVIQYFNQVQNLNICVFPHHITFKKKFLMTSIVQL